MLIIPVENQVRELDAKLLLACVAAERGMPVILGSRTYVNFAMPFLPRGVFLAKSLRSISRRMLDLIRGLGHDIVAWDEESLVRFTSPEYYAWRYSEDTFRVVERLFAWGEDDAEFFAAYPGYDGVPIHVTGNPRIDLLRADVRGYFAPEVAALQERHGDFILINTNFSFVNNFVPSLNLLNEDAVGQPALTRTSRGMSLAFATGMAAHQQAIDTHFRALLPRLSQWFPHTRIVLRPHPSENHAVWRQIAADLPNVEVIHSGNVVPWLMAARVLLHNGCTTAVEAAMVGTPAVSYQPVASAIYDYHLPNGLSHCTTTPAAVRDRIGEILAGQRGVSDAYRRAHLFARHLHALDGPLACDRVVDVLLANGYGARRPAPARLRRYTAWLSANGRTLIKCINRLRRDHRNSAAYHAHRFPRVTAAELDARIARFGARLGRFQAIRAEPLSAFVFRIGDTRATSRQVASDGVPLARMARTGARS